MASTRDIRRRVRKTKKALLYVLVAMPNGDMANFSMDIDLSEIHLFDAKSMCERCIEPGYASIASILKLHWVEAPKELARKLTEENA